MVRLSDAHPVGMSGSDVIAFSHTRGRTDYWTSEFAFLDSREETSLFLHHCPSSEFRANTRDVLEDGFARSVIHLNVVHEVWKWGSNSGSACVDLAVWPGADPR